MTKFNFAAVNKLFDTIAADATQHAFALMGSGVDGAGRNKGPIERMIKRLQDLEVAAANGLPYKDPIDTGKEASEKDTDAMNRARLLRIASAAARMNVQDAENELKGYAQTDLRPRTRRFYGAAREALTIARQACDELNKEAQADEYAATQMAGKEVEAQTEKNGRTWNRDLQAANSMLGDAYRSGNMKSAKDYFAHLKTLRAQLANEISELKMNLDMADKMIAERDRMLFEGSPGEHKEDASEKAAERVSLSAVFGGDKNGGISAEENEGAKRAIGQANRLLSDASTPLIAANEALGGNWLAKMRAARAVQHIRDAMQSVARAKSALNDSANKEAPERPTLPSGRYADVDPGRLLGED